MAFSQFHPRAAIGIEIPFQTPGRRIEPSWRDIPNLAPLLYSDSSRPPLNPQPDTTPEPDDHFNAAFLSYGFSDIRCGRDGSQCHVKLFADDGVSRLHFSLKFNEHKAWMIHLHSAHETTFNGHALRGEIVRALQHERVNVVGLPGGTIVRIYVAQDRDGNRVWPRLPYIRTTSPYYELETLPKLANGGSHIMEVSSGRHFVAHAVGKRFFDVTQRILRYFIGPNALDADLIAPVMGFKEDSQAVLEGFYRGTCLEVGMIERRDVAALLLRLSEIFEHLSKREIDFSSINLEDLILLEDKQVSRILLSRAWATQNVLSRKLAPSEPNAGIQNVAQLVTLAIRDSNERETSLRQTIPDPISYELLTRMQSSSKVLGASGEICSYLRSFADGGFETPFELVSVMVSTYVRFKVSEDGTVWMCAKDVALLFERHSRCNGHPRDRDKYVIGRARRHAGLTTEGEDGEVDLEACYRIETVLTLVRGGLYRHEDLEEQLEQQIRQKRAHPPTQFGMETMRFDTRTSVRCLRQTGLVNTTQLQERMGKLLKVKIPDTSRKIQEVKGRLEYAGTYIHIDILASRPSKSFRFDRKPEINESSPLAQKLRMVDPKQYVIFDTESCSSSRLAILHRETFSVKWGFQADNCAQLCYLSKFISLEESYSICDRFGFHETKQAMKKFISAPRHDLSLLLDEPLPLRADNPSGSDTDIEDWDSNEPLRFRRRRRRRADA